MNINDIVRFVQDLKKKGRVGNISEQQIVDAVNMASLDLFNYYYGLPEMYQLGRPVPPVNYEQTQQVSDALRPFKIILKSGDSSLTYNSSTGVITLPSNYFHITQLYYILNNQYINIDVVDDARWAKRLARITAAPSIRNPIANFRSNTIQLAPTGLTNVEMLYLKQPTKAVWGYTVVSGRKVYDSGTSTQLEWLIAYIPQIIVRTCKYLGVELEDQELYGFSDAKIKEGV